MGRVGLRGLQEGEEGEGGEVDGGDVCVEDVGPFRGGFGVPEVGGQLSGVGGFGDALGAGDAGVGDEEVEVFFLGREVFDEFLELGLGCYVAGSDSGV